MCAECLPRVLCMCDVLVYVLQMLWLPMECVLRVLGYASMCLCLWCTCVFCAMLCAPAYSRFVGARWMHLLTPATSYLRLPPGDGAVETSAERPSFRTGVWKGFQNLAALPSFGAQRIRCSGVGLLASRQLSLFPSLPHHLSRP